MNKSILTNFGGQGCIFNPSIPCKNEKRTKKKVRKVRKVRNKKFQKLYLEMNPRKENLK